MLYGTLKTFTCKRKTWNFAEVRQKCFAWRHYIQSHSSFWQSCRLVTSTVCTGLVAPCIPQHLFCSSLISYQSHLGSWVIKLRVGQSLLKEEGWRPTKRNKSEGAFWEGNHMCLCLFPVHSWSWNQDSPHSPSLWSANAWPHWAGRCSSMPLFPSLIYTQQTQNKNLALGIWTGQGTLNMFYTLKKKSTEFKQGVISSTADHYWSSLCGRGLGYESNVICFGRMWL